jgi:hypothetical protein
MDVQEIVRLEASLNTIEVRAIPDAVLAILDKEFIEIDSRGRIWDAHGVAEALLMRPPTKPRRRSFIAQSPTPAAAR